MKKKLAVVMMAIGMICLFAACGSSTEEESQNPTMNIVGEYQDSVSQRASMKVEAGAEGTQDAKVTIDWANGATENVEWVMEGQYDADKNVINYENATKTVITTDEEGKATDSKVEYKDGSGSFTIGEENVITWQDDKEDAGKDCKFEFAS